MLSLAVLGLLTGPAVVAADELMDITHAAGYTEAQEINRPKSSIIIDAHTGDVVWADNVDEPRDPASMSKLMTLYLVFDAIKEGKLSESTVIRATETDEAITKIHAISNNKIVSGVDYTVSELITMTAVPSSNATTVMLANYLSDNDPDKFLDMMNAKAKELGMTNTQWNNASGAAAVAFQGLYTPQRYDIQSSNKTTARDLAILGYHFVNNHPEILNYTKDAVVTVKAGTPYQETFETYNYSLPGARYALAGVDGLKTGSSPEGAFNYIATINRDGQRFVEVIMGVGDWSDQNGEYYRHPFGNALAEKAYEDFEYKEILGKGQHEIDGQTVTLETPLYATVKRGINPKVVIKDGQLVVENGLDKVSPKISSTVEASIGTDKAPSREGKSGQASERGDWLATVKSQVRYWQEELGWAKILFITVFAFLFMLILMLLVLRSGRKKKARRQDNKAGASLSRRNR